MCSRFLQYLFISSLVPEVKWYEFDKAVDGLQMVETKGPILAMWFSSILDNSWIASGSFSSSI